MKLDFEKISGGECSVEDIVVDDIVVDEHGKKRKREERDAFLNLYGRIDLRLNLSPEERERQNLLFEEHRKFALFMANRYFSFSGNDKVELDDLVQTAYIALLRACLDYDSVRGKFTSYAAFWIKGALRMHRLNSSSVIRLSGRQWKLINKYNSVVRGLESLLGRPPFIFEIEEELSRLGEPIEIESVVASLRLMLVSTLDSISDLKSDEENQVTNYRASLENNYQPDQVEFVDRQVLIDRFLRLLKENLLLTKDEKNADKAIEIFVRYFHLVFLASEELDDVHQQYFADKFNVSPQRVSQILLYIYKIIKDSTELKELLACICTEDDLVDYFRMV